MKYFKKWQFFIISLMLIVGLAVQTGCQFGGGSDNPAGAAAPETVIFGRGNGTDQVRFAQSLSGFNSLNLQLRLTGLASDTEITAEVPLADGRTISLSRASIPAGESIVLAPRTIELAMIPAFEQVKFSQNLMPDVAVEIINADDTAARGLSTLRAAALPSPYPTRLRGDFNKDSVVNSHDVAFYISWAQVGSNIATAINDWARKILPNLTGEVVFFPNENVDDYNGNAIIDSQDIVFLIAGFQTGSLDKAIVKARAVELLSGVDTDPVYLAGDPMPTVNFPKTITGMNSLGLQIRVHNVSADAFPADKPLLIVTGRQSGADVSIKFFKSSMPLPGGVIFAAKDGTAPVPLSDFNSVTLLVGIPAGGLVEVYNKDVNQVVTAEAGPAKPTFVVPQKDQEHVDIAVVLTSSAFVPGTSGGTHLQTDWEIWSSSDLSSTYNRFWYSYATASKTAIIVSDKSGAFSNTYYTELAKSTEYWVRCRFYDSRGASSQWSELVKFKTWNQPSQPSLSVDDPANSPAVYINPRLNGSDFYSSNSAAHQKTDWEVYAESILPANRVWSRLNSTTSLKSIVVNSQNGTFGNALAGKTSLAFNSLYVARVRYIDSLGVPTPWSSPVQIQTQGYAAKPTITLPAANATHVVVNPTLKTSAFSASTPGNTHQRTIWEIHSSASIDATTRVWYLDAYSTSLTAVEVKSGNGTFENALSGAYALSDNTTYYARAAHIDNTGISSDWSSLVTFKTWRGPAKPSITSPADGALEVAVEPSLTASVFSDADTGDTHLKTDWEIRSYEEFTYDAYVVWRKNGSTNLTSITVNAANGEYVNGQTKLNAYTKYWARVRYYDNHGAPGEWSEPVEFTTQSPPNKPWIGIPIYWYNYQYQYSVLPNPAIDSTWANDPAGENDRHTMTDWEVWDEVRVGDTFSVNKRVWYKNKDTHNLIRIYVTTANGTFENSLAGKTGLSHSTVYYARARHYDNHGSVSDWSNWIRFFSKTPPRKPAIASPVANQTHVSIYETKLDSGEFLWGDEGDTHLKSDWEIYEDATLAADKLVWSKSQDETNKATIRVNTNSGSFANSHLGYSFLDCAKNYWVRIRHYDQSGLPTPWSDAVKFTTRPKAKQVHAGLQHSVALMDDGTVWTWGANTYGQLGLNDKTDRTMPAKVTTLSDIKQIWAGHDFTLALSNSGNVYAWGHNDQGQLGDGTTTDRTAPKQISTLSGITKVVAAKDFSMALDGNGDIWMWGDNTDGKLGDGTVLDQSSPVKFNKGGLTYKFIDIAATYYTYGLKEDGSVIMLKGSVSYSTGVRAIFAGKGSLYNVKTGGMSYSTNNGGNIPSDKEIVSVNGGYSSVYPIFLYADGSTSDTVNQVVSVTQGGNLTSDDFYLYAKTDGTLWGNGYDDRGQLGRETTGSVSEITQVHW